MELDTITGLLRLALITATPIALGAYAGIMSERAGGDDFWSLDSLRCIWGVAAFRDWHSDSDPHS